MYITLPFSPISLRRASAASLPPLMLSDVTKLMRADLSAMSVSTMMALAPPSTSWRTGATSALASNGSTMTTSGFVAPTAWSCCTCEPVSGFGGDCTVRSTLCSLAEASAPCWIARQNVHPACSAISRVTLAFFASEAPAVPPSSDESSPPQATTPPASEATASAVASLRNFDVMSYSSSWSLPRALAAAELIDVDSGHEHDTDGDVLPERIDLDDHEAVEQHSGNQDADDRARHAATAPEQAGSADDDGGDGGERVLAVGR